MISNSLKVRLDDNYDSGELKFLQYFGNMKHNSAALNAFTEVEKVMMHIGHHGQWDVELVWYNPDLSL